MSHATVPRGLDSSADRFRDRAQSHRRRPWLRALAVMVVVGLVAGGAWVLGWSTLLGVRQVEVVGASGEQREAVADLVRVPVGTPLVRVDTEAVETRVRSLLTVAEVSARRSFPDTLEVRVVPRVAAIVVKNPQGRLEVVDATGVAFGFVDEPPADVPVVTATGSRGTTPEALRTSLALLQSLPPDLARTVSKVTVTSADLVTFTLGKRTVVWGGAADADRKVAIIRALLTTKAKVIDVSAPDTPVTR